MIGRVNTGSGGLKSAIIVTAPAGSTVTCTKGTTVKTAREKDGKWTFKNLDLGAWTVTATLDDQTAVKTVTLEQLTVVYLTLAYRSVPEFTYTGDYEIVQDDDTPIEKIENWYENWKIRFLTSGTLTITDTHLFNGYVDIFCVGGGGCGSAGGGGGGYTSTRKHVLLEKNKPYDIVIGAGSDIHTPTLTGGKTSFGGEYLASGGYNADEFLGGNGGSGGGTGYGSYPNGGFGGSNGENGGPGSRESEIGYGQMNKYGPNGEYGNTREFGEEDGRLYAGGGAAQRESGDNTLNPGSDGGGGGTREPGQDNTGGGGGGRAGYSGLRGGSGIVVIRNWR